MLTMVWPPYFSSYTYSTTVWGGLQAKFALILYIFAKNSSHFVVAAEIYWMVKDWVVTNALLKKISTV